MDGSRQVSQTSRGEAAKRVADATPPPGKKGPLVDPFFPTEARHVVPRFRGHPFERFYDLVKYRRQASPARSLPNLKGIPILMVTSEAEHHSSASHT